MLEISVCIGSACHLKGSYKVINALQELIKENQLADKVDIKGVFCLGHCTTAVSVQIKDEIFSVNEENVVEFFKENVINKING